MTFGSRIAHTCKAKFLEGFLVHPFAHAKYLSTLLPADLKA